MKTKNIGFACVLCIACCAGCVAWQDKPVGAQQTPVMPVDDSASVSRMENRTTNKNRDPGLFGDYWWANRFLSRHMQIKKLNGGKVDVVMLGDSIMHFWEWLMPESWATFAKGRSVLNLGYGGDTTRQVIWRIEHGELDGYEARNVVILIGTNNNASKNADPASVAEAVKKIVRMVRERQPKAQIVLNAIFPRGQSAKSEVHARARVNNDATNAILKQFADEDGTVTYLDLNSKFLDGTGWVPKTLMYDEVHPTPEGYAIWVEALNRVLK